MVGLTERGLSSVLRQCLRQAEVQRRRGVTIALTELTEFGGVVCRCACVRVRPHACARVRACALLRQLRQCLCRYLISWK